jgi:large subunit ribosomal protein L9
LEDVKNLGKKGDIVEASDSYARNVLLKKKIAVEANGRTMNDLKLRTANDEKVAAQNLEDAKALAEKLAGMHITLKVKVGEGGKLFGSVSSKEIAEAVKDQLGIEVDRKKIQLGSPIRSTGEVMVPIRLHTAVTAQLRTVIESL